MTQKTEQATVKVIIANKLDDGRTVFLSAQGGWTSQISQASVAITTEQTDHLLKLAQQDHDKNLVIAPIAIDAVLSGGGIFSPASAQQSTTQHSAVSAKHIKYQIQSTGPSVRPDLTPPSQLAAE